MNQINPPFDGSEPCPMCSSEIRNISALIHNFLVRWPETKAFVKLNDLKQYWQKPEITVPHSAVSEMVAVAEALIDACHDLTQDEKYMIRWTPGTVERVQALIPRAEASEAALDSLSEEHWRDSRHSHGTPNILREENSSRRIRFLSDYDHRFTVEVVPECGDLTHEACGTNLKLHQHFKDNLARDPTFYGQVWCPTCRQNFPFSQFTDHTRLPQETAGS